jgi:hypothetical protein
VRLGPDHLLGDAHDGAHVALELGHQKIEVLARREHGLLGDVVVPRQGEDVGLVRGARGVLVELLLDLCRH